MVKINLPAKPVGLSDNAETHDRARCLGKFLRSQMFTGRDEIDEETGVHHLVVEVNPDCEIFTDNHAGPLVRAIHPLILGDYQREQLKMLNGDITEILPEHFEEIEIEVSEFAAYRREYRLMEWGESYWSSHSDEAFITGGTLAGHISGGWYITKSKRGGKREGERLHSKYWNIFLRNSQSI